MTSSFSAASFSTRIWQDKIEKLRAQTRIPDLDNALTCAVQQAFQNKPVLLFSGGLDSSVLALLATQQQLPFTALSVGITGSHDSSHAREAAQLLNIPLIFKELSIKEAEHFIQLAASLVPEKSVVHVSVGAVMLAAMKTVAHNKCSSIVTGIGSDELFCGYAKHQQGNEELRNKILLNLETDIKRDTTLANHFGLQSKSPFLDDEVITAALNIPMPELLLNGGKSTLRKLALARGMPTSLATQKKRAAQYSTGMDKILGKLARKNSMTKEEYVLSLGKN